VTNVVLGPVQVHYTRLMAAPSHTKTAAAVVADPTGTTLLAAPTKSSAERNVLQELPVQDLFQSARDKQREVQSISWFIYMGTSYSHRNETSEEYENRIDWPGRAAISSAALRSTVHGETRSCPVVMILGHHPRCVHVFRAARLAKAVRGDTTLSEILAEVEGFPKGA
jgi:hypothetical protein